MNPSPSLPDRAPSQPLALRCRPDLVIAPQTYRRERYWLVKDPLALNYFHLRDEEHAILRMLDGKTGVAEIKARFEKRFAPYLLPFEQLQAFLGRLHECGLILSDAQGQGEQLLERADSHGWRHWAAAWTNLLAIRFRGIDPEPLLDWLYPKIRWLFSQAALFLLLALVLSAVALVLLQLPRLQARWSDVHDFFHPGNVLWLAIILAAVKVLHELGHALCCKHFGGQCQELGFMLLVFAPCLYCDVSDAWTFAGKWRRIAVSAAGIAVEVFLASAATFLWWFSQPGLVRSLCLNVMVVCSVSTLLFNGNPLVRYDGYHVLADFLEVPNLADQSRAVLARMTAWLFLGIRRAADRMLPVRGRWLLGLYGMASVAYRWFISLAILWLVHRVTKSYGLAAIGNVLAFAVVAGLILLPAWRLAAFLRRESFDRGFRRLRALFFLALWAGAIVVLAMVPLPYRVTAPVVLEPENARPVYAVVAGTLVRSLQAGDLVERNQEVARLVNLDLRKEIVELTGTRNQQRRQVEVLRLGQVQDRGIAALVPTAEAALEDIEQRLRQRQRDEERLVLRAPVGGVILPPPRSAAAAPAFGQLPAWKGTPLDEQNRDCHVETGTLVCLVGSPQPLEAFAVIDQDDVALVHEGQRVRIRLDFLPAQILYGTIVEIAKSDLKAVPRELATGADLAVRVDPRGVARPLSISYQARVRLDEQPGVSLLGGRGQTKILVEPQSLAERLYRGLRQTFEIRW